MNRLFSTIAAICALSLPLQAFAEGTLSVSFTNNQGENTVVEYSTDDLLELDATKVETTNDYVEGDAVFEGPLLRSLFADIGLSRDSEIKVTALNDYSTVIPASEALDYDVIVAVLMNGKPMSVRDKGPFWVIYPMNDNPELQEPSFNDRLIWQLAHVELLPGS